MRDSRWSTEMFVRKCLFYFISKWVAVTARGQRREKTMQTSGCRALNFISPHIIYIYICTCIGKTHVLTHELSLQWDLTNISPFSFKITSFIETIRFYCRWFFSHPAWPLIWMASPKLTGFVCLCVFNILFYSYFHLHHCLAIHWYILHYNE